MKSRDYWLKRYIQEKAIVIKNSQTYELKLNERLNWLLSVYDGEIKKYYNRYAYNFGIPVEKAEEMLKDIEYQDFDNTLEQFKQKAIEGGFEKELSGEYFKSQVARLKQLESQLKQHSQTLFSVEKFKMRDELIDEFKHTYYHQIYNIQDFKGEYRSNFNKLNTDMLENVIYNPWAKDDKNFSERLWGTYVDSLPNAIMDTMLRHSLLGTSPNEMTRQVHDRFDGMKRKHVHRLVVTELGHAQEEATAESYKQQEIEEYDYMATLESHTCSVCRVLDGKTFKMSERVPGLNYPLMHPYCRCTTVPHIVLSDDLPPRQRWTPNGLTSAKTFDEWAEMTGVPN